MVFNLQGSEVIVILLLALVVSGPEKLPDAIRKFSRTYGELKKMGSGFSSEFKSAIDEPMREMRETGDLIRNAADPSTYVDKAPTAPTSDAPLTPAPVDDAAGVAAGAAAAATAGTADEAPGTADDASGTANEAPGTVGDPPGAADAAGAVDGAPGAADDRVDSADPSDPGSTTIATPGDPPTPSGPPRNLIEARRDGKLTPVDGVAADGAAADGVAAASEVTGGGSPNGEAPEGVAVSGAEAIDEAATA
jgi:sec-independent protein translocase protein TatB